MTADALGIPVNKGSNNEATLHGSAVGLLRHGPHGIGAGRQRQVDLLRLSSQPDLYTEKGK